MSASPRLVVDLDVLERTITTMARTATGAGVRLRPHVKTHKVPQIAAMQRDAGAHGLTVATVGEAEVFADAGFDDIFIAYPIWLDAEDGRRLAAVTESAHVSVGCDSMTAARQLRRALGGAPVDVLVEIDSGQHRTGVPSNVAGELAAGIAGLGFTVAGVFTFPGHSYGPDARANAAAQEREALRAASVALRSKGIDAPVRSGGSSPSMAYLGARASEDDATALTEMRPGAYVFNDAQQWELGACGAEDIALTAHATVISHAGGRLVLNAGSKTLAPDKAARATGHGRLLDHPEARIVQLSEHHAVVDMAGESLPAIGSTVRAVPNHCCNAVNSADALDVVRGGRHVDTWPVAARGMN